MDHYQVFLSEHNIASQPAICKSKLSYGGKKKYYFLHGSVSVGNSCSYLLATSFTSPFTQVWDEMLSSGDAGDRKLQLRGQE